MTRSAPSMNVAEGTLNERKTDMGKSLFRVIARATKVGRTCYIHGSFSRQANPGIGYVYSNRFSKGCALTSALSQRRGRRRRRRSGRQRHGSACLHLVWKCEVEELNRISTSMPRKRAGGRDSFGNSQSRAKIRTLMQPRNAI